MALFIDAADRPTNNQPLIPNTPSLNTTEAKVRNPGEASLVHRARCTARPGHNGRSRLTESGPTRLKCVADLIERQLMEGQEAHECLLWVENGH